MARRTLYSSIEALEARIAPANLSVFHPLVDLIPAAGKTSSVIDLGASIDSSPNAGYRTHVEFLTNFDTDFDPSNGIQAGKIVLELFDDKAPLTVQNFLGYVNSASATGDYDGTFFHRFSPGFVLQGGGYQISKTGISHITARDTVHNEFDANDPERSNTIGTVAMAKTNDPNSATSEFFFNLGNNSFLDSSNGGFTVFAKVVQGMDIVNAISSLPTAQLPGLAIPGDPAGAGTPYQNGYVEDPDNNPSTPSPTPKPSQVIQITKASVIPPTNSTVAKTQWSVVSITDQQGNPSDLISTNANGNGVLPGDTLRLNYQPGESGIATVKVMVKNLADPSSDPVLQEFQVKVQPNLLVQNGGDTLPLVSVNGDTGTGTVKLVNTGAAAAIGTVDVKYYLSKVEGNGTGVNDPTGTKLDASDLLIGSLTGATINIGSGKTGTLTANLAIPDDATITSGSYRILAHVTASDGSTIVEGFTDDNVMLDGRVHGYFTGESKANLTAIGMSENLPALLLPGDTGIAKIGIGNSASHIASGLVNVSFYLSYDANPLNSTDGLDGNDMLIGTLTKPLTLAAGQTANIDVPIAFPKTLNYADGYYRIFGVVTSPEGSSNISELTLSDNLVASNYHLAQHAFGTVGFSNTLIGPVGRVNAPLTYENAAGDDITLKITGRGFGTVAPTASGGIQVSLEGTNLLSSFSVVASAGVTPVFENILSGANSGTAIGSLNLGNVAWTGSVVAYGGVKNLTLGGTTGETDHFIGIGTSAVAVAAKLQPVIKMGSVQDLTVTSNLTIASFTASKWLDVNSRSEVFTSVGLLNFAVTAGNFEADMLIENFDPTKTAAVKSFAVAGTVKSSEIRIAGNVGTVRLGAIESSKLLVGTDVVPVALQDFNAARAIASITITGVQGSAAGFVDSEIAASRFGSIKVLTDVAETSGDGDFGFIADKIASYTRGGDRPLLNLNSAQEVDIDGNYRVTVLA